MLNKLDISRFNSLSVKEQMLLIGQDPGDRLWDSRYIDFNLRIIGEKAEDIKSHHLFLAIISKLEKTINTLSKPEKRFNAEILIANLYNACFIKNRYYLHIPMNPGVFTKINKSIERKIIFRDWQRTVFLFEKVGLIERTRGIKFANQAYYTRVKPTKKFFDEIIDRYEVTYKNLYQTHKLIECINGYLPDRSTRRIYEIEKRLVKYNELLLTSDIDLPEEVMADFYHEKNLALRTYKRSFNKNLYSYGRFHGPYWQTLPKKIRALIKINGEKTVELDYEAMFLHMLYSKRGLDLFDFCPKSEDPYNVGFNRKIIKAAFTACVNKNCDRENINYVVSKSAKKILKGNFKKGINYRQELDKLALKHKPVGDLFYKNVGNELCYMESRIADLVIRYLTKKKIPVLSIHDSFIVPISKVDKLYNSMLRAFKTLKYTSIPNIKGYPIV